jgi:hypothetical protein
MHQTDGIYWHDYILICLFDSCFAKHGLVLSDSFQPSILLLNTLKYTHVCSKCLKKFCFVLFCAFGFFSVLLCLCEPRGKRTTFGH